MATPNKPELWCSIVAKYKASSKGSTPGQWSARSAQLAALEYKSRGGTWSGDGDKSSESLSAWSRQNWRTRDGGKARKAGGSTKRYLPDAAWKSMSPAEREATDRKKRRRKTAQFVRNTARARRARKAVS